MLQHAVLIVASLREGRSLLIENSMRGDMQRSETPLDASCSYLTFLSNL